MKLLYYIILDGCIIKLLVNYTFIFDDWHHFENSSKLIFPSLFSSASSKHCEAVATANSWALTTLHKIFTIKLYYIQIYL